MVFIRTSKLWEAVRWAGRAICRAARFFWAAVHGFNRHRSSLHAAGLTYFSLMSLAPIVCLILLFARMCGLGDFARERLNGYIDEIIESVEQGGDNMPVFIEAAQDPAVREARRQTAHDFAIQARETMNSIIDRIVAYDVHAMGLVGILMLLWTVISTLGMVENSLNELWEIPKSRPFARRLAIYAVMALVLPVFALISASMPLLHLLRRLVAMIFETVGLSGWIPSLVMWIVNSKVFGWSVSLVFATLGFAFFLGFMPNRKVPRKYAMWAGLLTAFFFGCWLRLCAVAQVGISRASAMYGSFAVLPILLTWLYISWQIVLFGGAMASAMSKSDRNVRRKGAAVVPGGL